MGGSGGDLVCRRRDAGGKSRCDRIETLTSLISRRRLRVVEGELKHLQFVANDPPTLLTEQKPNPIRCD